MALLLARKLIVVTGKGGAGKSTIAAALGLLGARRGLRTMVATIDGQGLLPALYGHPRSGGSAELGKEKPEGMARPEPGEEVLLAENLSALCIDPDAALFDWLRRAGGRIPARALARSTSFQYFAAAAPGAKELTCMIEAGELVKRYDLTILDAPATGHALAMLASPDTFTTVVRSGPLSAHARDVRKLLADERRTGYVAVAHASELAVSETLELEQGLRLGVERDLEAVIVNGVLPRRFTREELERIAALSDPQVAERAGLDPALARAAARAAGSAGERARHQQSQLARLRRLRFGGGKGASVVTVPFLFAPVLDIAAVHEIANRLDGALRQLRPS
jgi:anion-transporting  ArsA/GET3 family ATPase